ncbi:WXG100-like domain-containing protein [Nocardia sp. NBC_00416]|uniref:WXG100-like domain-containing protein n=1 Tax=Nocardia sp. NBC_00416 TaxID=2975991 RepID=UPI002E200F7C
MAIEIPHDVALFLNFIGIPYPDINEDQVRELASHVRTFADEVSGTHQSATGAINDMGSVYQGRSYRALVASWATLSSSHMERLDELCKGVAKALEIAAEVIAVVKVAVLTELALLAAAYTAAMGASVATSGVSAAVGQSLAMAAKRLVRAMEEMLVAYILAEVLGRAIEPLEEAVSDMISGVVYNATADLLGVDGGGNEALLIDPDEVRRYAQVLDDHADDIMKHADKFANGVAALDFTTPIGMPPGVADPAVRHAVTPGPSGKTGPLANSRPFAAGEPGVRDRPASIPESVAAPRNWIPGAGNTASPDSAPATGSAGKSAAPAAGSGGAAPATDRPGAAAASPGGSMPGTVEAPPAGTRGESPPVVGAQDRRSEPEGAVHAVGPANRAPGDPGAAAATDRAVDAAAGPGGAARSGAAGGGSGAELSPGGTISEGSPESVGAQTNPWNRPAAGSGGAGEAAPGRPPGRKAADTAGAGRPVGARRRRSGRPNPWTARPAADAEPARTPWGKSPGGPQPAVPGVVAAGDAPPPVDPTGRDRDPARGADVEVAVQPGAPPPVDSTERDQERDTDAAASASRSAGAQQSTVSSPVVSAPTRADEGPPRV